MASLSILPFEIQSMILDHCGFTTTRSYALVAKATTPAANRHLYREICLGPASHVTQWTCETVQYLLRTLTRRPDLAALVKNVHLDVDYTGNFVEEKRYLGKVSVGRAISDCTSLAKTVVEDLGFPNSRSWDIKLRHTSLDPWISLLLTQLTSMETLKLGPALLHKSTFLGLMFEHLIKKRPNHFARLRSVSLGPADGGYKVAGLDYGRELYMPFFHLSSLEEFEVSLEHFPKLGERRVDQTPSSLTTFRLLRSGGITPKQLEDLMVLTPRLKTLHLGWNEEIKSGFVPFIPFASEIDFEAIKSVLGAVSPTLTTLTIGVTHYRPKTRQLAAEDDPTLPFLSWAASPLGSLASFASLEHLEVPVNVLLDHIPWAIGLADVLPKSLKSLVLSDETLTWRQGVYEDLLMPWEHSLHTLVNLLVQYLVNHELCAPRLTSVVLDFTAAIGSDGSVPEALEDKLRRIAEASRITVELHYVQAYPLEYWCRLYPVCLTIYNRQTPEVEPIIGCGGPLSRVPLYWCPREWSRRQYAYRFPMQKALQKLGLYNQST
ncbi:hypothetical protein BJY01DRAFT_254507 [Aspergillus pseudoustus]|uniref:F-box domain-containing protein n=1 Tax=Aspergillus pseudoustus TaxID=1810923 RepID=A0ABR4ISR8_9EURO